MLLASPIRQMFGHPTLETPYPPPQFWETRHLAHERSLRAIAPLMLSAENDWSESLAAPARHLKPTGALVVVYSLARAGADNATHCNPRSAAQYDTMLGPPGMRITEHEKSTTPGKTGAVAR